MAVAGQSTDADQSTDANLETVVDVYNDRVDEVPGVIRDRFADERVEVVIEHPDGADETYTAVTDDSARVTSLEAGSDDPTIRVTTDASTVGDVAESDDAVDTAVDAYRSDRVDVEGVGLANSVAIEATKVGYAVGSQLGLL
jgi:hypothetical protein